MVKVLFGCYLNARLSADEYCFSDGEGLGDDYVALMQQLSPYADYLVINISSPNTPNLRLLQVHIQAYEFYLSLYWLGLIFIER